jgi:hypothetical protein
LFQIQIPLPFQTTGPIFDPTYDQSLQWYSFDRSSRDIMVVPGQSYWLNFDGENADIGISGVGSTPYGGLCVLAPFEGWQCDDVWTGKSVMDFKTWVDPTPNSVPEPSALAILATGLLGLLGLVRRTSTGGYSTLQAAISS